MAMDRLRNEVADLALLDDLTGVGNRRHLVQRLTEECARSERCGQPFSLLVIDLDGFKASTTPMATPPATPACSISP